MDTKENKDAEKSVSVQLENRDAVIIRTSIIGIIANIFLAGFKAAVGILSNSISSHLFADISFSRTLILVLSFESI